MHRGDVERPRCEHVALVHSGVDDLSRRLAPSLHRASAEGATILLCLDERAQARVRADFGSVSDSFVFSPATTRYANPGVAMAALDRFVVEAMAAGAPTAWSIGSIPLEGDGRDSRWIRYEEAVDAVFADRPLRAVCLYDASTTPLAVRDGVESAHQSIDGEWSNDAAAPSPVSNELFTARAPDLVMSGASAREVRAAITTLFGDSVSSEVLDNLRWVASELTSNVIRHGSPPAEIRAWDEQAWSVIQVHDAGTETIDPYADLRPCTGGAHGGFGLWTVGQLADAVQITHDARGNTVTVRLAAR